ncbi:hypothetical protein Lfu02_39450 [Longispora fulva]|uniref:Uncharacterized protein n=1 Tax=Longispora fulva TaxID=619741 RepID=A0A8J7GEI5_9ACTN|nr:hypothetical protein [Longispora fulva]GIG59573.1 hypothetical protein Lfu02_39450 [Longispora fulva]
MADFVLVAIVAMGFTSAFLAKAVAQRKGLDPQRYFMFGIAFGIFSLIAVVMRSPRGFGPSPTSRPEL